MHILKRLLASMALVLLALVAVAYLLPREVHVMRAVTIDAPVEAVFAQVNSMQATEAWSPWLDRDPEVQLRYSGPEAGVGNRLDWRSDHPQVGNGTQEIIQSEANRRVTTTLAFDGRGTAQAEFMLTGGVDGTEVVWNLITDTGMNPVTRWMGLFMDKWVGADYEVGLNNLKTLVES